jgi:galactokinase
MESDAFGFPNRFGHAPEVSGHAPGRVNLMGEHTDYNEGYVLPVAIPQQTIAEVARRGGLDVRAASANQDRGRLVTYRLGEESRRGSWIDYVQGVTAELRRRDIPLEGFDLWIRSAVPVGSGLSSSAALEVSLLRALRELYHFSMDDITLALAGQRAENDLVGAPVGIMDQMASSLASVTAALFLDTRTLESERIPIPAGIEIAVIDSGVRHDHAAGAYRVRRQECEEAARRLGVRALRDVPLARMSDIEALPPLFRKRARHVVTENARVLQSVGALRHEDFVCLGEIFAASHMSQRDDFEVSVPEVDRIVKAADADLDVFGARLTGGGFGGSIVLLAAAGRGRKAAERVLVRARAYGARIVAP